MIKLPVILGLDLTDIFKLYYKKTVSPQGLPF